MTRKIYVASSWRNTLYPSVVEILREAGNDVYDFRFPHPDQPGFSWRNIAEGWKDWTPQEYIAGLDHEISCGGFADDFSAMKWADTCVLVLPCGKSAHIEAGWFTGAGKDLFILLNGPMEPELMYRLALTTIPAGFPASSRIATDVGQLLVLLRQDDERREAIAGAGQGLDPKKTAEPRQLT